MFDVVSVLLIAALSLAVRWTFSGHAAASRIDHHYWLLTAAAYRQQRRLPVRISNKFLLEEEAQAYPPFYGWLLARLPERWLHRGEGMLSNFVDMATLALLVASARAMALDWVACAAIVAVYGIAPVLVNYNTQFNPRVFGQLFLVGAVLLQVMASTQPLAPVAQGISWAGAAILVGLIIVSHKMTTQLSLFLWPFFSIVLDFPQALLVVPAGVAVSVLITGPKFALYQWRAHWDIVRFWDRHWPELGAHMFRKSPLYGNPGASNAGLFHEPGLKGVAKHLRTVAGYAPFNLFLPLTLPWVAPPAWLGVWFYGSYAFVLLTLFMSRLKCLGGGHYYVLNACAAGAMYWGFLVQSNLAGVWSLFAVGLAATVVALFHGWRIIARRSTALDSDFDRLIERLRALPQGRVAVFPFTASDAVAASSHHAVLWGGHSYGFDRLEGIWPVVRRPLRAILAEYGIDWVVWDRSYWPDGEEKLRAEGIIGEGVEDFGRWCLVRKNAGDPLGCGFGADAQGGKNQEN